MSDKALRRVAVAGIVALAALLLWPPSAARFLAVVPLAALILAATTALSRWAIATAILMLPYFSYAVMETIIDPAVRLKSAILATLTVTVFLAAADSVRRGS